jgi:hypothetical protein
MAEPVGPVQGANAAATPDPLQVEIDGLLIKLSQTENQQEISRIAKKLKEIAFRSEAAAKRVITSVSGWYDNYLNKQTASVRKWTMITLLHDIGNKFKNLRSEIIPILKKAFKDKASSNAVANASCTLYEWGVPGYEPLD